MVIGSFWPGLRWRSAFLRVALLSVASCGCVWWEDEVRMVRLLARALREEGRAADGLERLLLGALGEDL